ncbi:MAG TPA: VIT domain-containing protein [Polyangiaceae bacterium]|nr:VIT domain-containing protein [Polyangiaceae bacterium]
MTPSLISPRSPVMRTSPYREPAPPSPSRLVAPDGRSLPLASTALRAAAGGGIARVVVEQRFRNVHAEALSVTYTLPLPADAAVSGFAFTLDGRRVVGQVDRREAARERFEQALVEGKTAALLDQERSSVFTQQVGNIPPGAEVVAEITLDQRLVWTDEGGWEWRFPTVVAPRYEGGPGRVPDAAAIAVEVSERPLEARASVDLAIGDALDGRSRPESPSHRVALEAGGARVRLADGAGARLDRDLVVRWRVAAPRASATARAARPPEGSPTAGEAYALVTLVPPPREAAPRPVPRDLIVLLDTSGSMHGEPLEQARRVVLALLATLTERDQIELIEFSDAARRFRPGPVAATREALGEARAWVARLRAGGGTEMRSGLLAALARPRPNAQRQVVLVTDGQIGFEQEIVSTLHERLPAGSRLHAVGVGSAVNRSLTAPAARAGRGVEIVIGLGEDPERAARRLVARTDAPIVTDLSIEGDALVAFAPEHLPDLYAGAPVLVAVKARPEGGALRVRGVTDEGLWEQTVELPALGPGEGDQAVVTLFGRERVDDLEMRVAAGGPRAGLDASIEAAGLAYQIATRLSSWVAVSEERTVDGPAWRRERVPHEVPHGMSIEGLGLRLATPMHAQPFGGLASIMPIASPAFAIAPSVGGPLRSPPAPGAYSPMKPSLAQSVRAPLAKRRSGGLLVAVALLVFLVSFGVALLWWLISR